MKVTYRNIQDGDIEFITASMLNFYQKSEFGRTMKKTTFMKHHHPLLHAAIKRGEVLISCMPGNEAVIFGYVIGERNQHNDIIHFIFIKPSFRKSGLGYELVQKFRQSPNLIFTHKMKMKEGDLYDSYIYNPYLFFKA